MANMSHNKFLHIFFYNSRTKSTDKVTDFYLSIIVLWRSETEEHLSAAKCINSSCCNKYHIYT